MDHFTQPTATIKWTACALSNDWPALLLTSQGWTTQLLCKSLHHHHHHQSVQQRARIVKFWMSYGVRYPRDQVPSRSDGASPQTPRKPVVVLKSPLPVSRMSSADESPLVQRSEEEVVKDMFALLHPALSYDNGRQCARAAVKEPLLLPCPHCYKTIFTEVVDRWGWLLCCCVTEAEHRCPSCRQSIAMYWK